LHALQKKTTSDLEHELNEFSRKLHSKSENLVDSFELNKKKLSELQVSQSHLAERINLFDEMQHQHFEKSLDLITLLKKERDFAKKLILDIEGETLALRNTYSKKLLSLEQEKAQSKSESYEKFKKRLITQENELEKKSQTISALKDTIEQNERRIKKFESQLKKK